MSNQHSNKNLLAAEGYEQLAAILQAAHDEAAYGKGKERHANDLPFHEQRMQTISGLIGGAQGMAFQAIKKLTEGLQFDDHKRRERELLGAINYIAGILVFYRNQPKSGSTNTDPSAVVSAERGNAVKEWPDEQRIDIIAQNGNGGEHYPKIGDYLPDQGGDLVGFIDGDGIIMSIEQAIDVNHESAVDFVKNLNKRSRHTDWRIPELKEVNLVWENIDNLDKIHFLHDFYWSSSWLTNNDVWVHDFSDGHQSPRNIRGEYIVRPIRTVKIEELLK